MPAQRMTPEEFRVVAHRFLVGEQNIRYEHLAAFMYKIYGDQSHLKHPFTQKSMENALRASRILTKEGEVRQGRIEKWAKSRGFKAHLTGTPEMWENITEGRSP